MKNKIIGLLGVIFILLSIGAWFAYSNTIKNNSELFGKEILVLKSDVKNGEKLTKDNVTVKKVKQVDIITNALTEKHFSEIENKVAAINLYRNEQLTLERIVDESSYKPETTRIVSLAIDGIGALSGTIKSGDLVDVWDEKDVTKKAELVLKDIEIIAIKDAQNQDADKIQGAIPTSIVLRVDNDENTEKIKSIQKAFVTKSTNQIKGKLDKYKKTDGISIGQKIGNQQESATTGEGVSQNVSESRSTSSTVTEDAKPGFKDESLGKSVGQ